MLQSKRLGELIGINPKSTLLVREATGGDFPFFTSGSSVLRHKDQLCSGPNVFVSTGGRPGFMYYDGPASYDCLSINSKIIDTKYLYYFLLSKKEEVDRMFFGAALKHLSRSEFLDIKVPLIERYQQEQIAAHLDRVLSTSNAIREKSRAASTNLESLWAKFISERLPNDGASYPISQVCQIGDGNHSSKYPKRTEMVPDGVPFIRASNVGGGEVKLDGMLFISDQKHADLAKGHLRPGDVLITNRGEIGKLAVVPPALERANLNSQLAWLRPRGEILSEYLLFSLQSDRIRAELKRRQTGAALQQLTIKALSQIEVHVPTLERQRTIVTQIKRGKALIDKVRSSFTRLSKQAKSCERSALKAAFPAVSGST